MRWQQLFADLEAQFDEAEATLERGEEASRARAEVGAVRLIDRLRGAVGTPVDLRCAGVGRLSGVLAEVGVDWLLLEDARARPALVALAAVRSVTGPGRWTAVPEEGQVWRRLDLRRALRGLARDRAQVQVVLDDGGVLTGTVDRVGADHVELAEHPGDRPRRAEAVTGVQLVALAAVVVVRTAPPAIV